MLTVTLLERAVGRVGTAPSAVAALRLALEAALVETVHGGIDLDARDRGDREDRAGR